MPNDPNFAEVRKSIPAAPGQASGAPTIFVSTKPAEIIVTNGPPTFAPVPGTALQQVRNSNAALFLDTGTGRFYYLVSGRWFASTGLDGPWTFATPDLPPDFALIPPSSAAGSVLPSVPGTAQAQQARDRGADPASGDAQARRGEARRRLCRRARFQADPRHRASPMR